MLSEPQTKNDADIAYRSQLMTLWQKSQEDFDKSVLSLSGGALGVSFVFLKDIVGANPIHLRGLLLAAWTCWGVSSLATLFSFLSSKWALWNCLCAPDSAPNASTAKIAQPKQRWIVRCWNWLGVSWQDRTTTLLNGSAALLFLCGLILMIVFVRYNLEGFNSGTKRSEATIKTARTSAETDGQE